MRPTLRKKLPVMSLNRSREQPRAVTRADTKLIESNHRRATEVEKAEAPNRRTERKAQNYYFLFPPSKRSEGKASKTGACEGANYNSRHTAAEEKKARIKYAKGKGRK